MNQWGFAYGVKRYNSKGNQIGLDQYDTNKEKIRSRDVPTNVTIKMTSVASQKDSIEIKRIALGYLIALQDLKPELMNDSLNKITIVGIAGLKRNLPSPQLKQK
jgi:hypothetical protein